MTIPYMMNCPHDDEGWCLTCVRELHDQFEAAAEREAKLREAATVAVSVMRTCRYWPLHDEATNGLRSALESKGGET